MVKNTLLLIAFNLTFAIVFAQSGAFGYEQLTSEQKEIRSVFHLPNQPIFKEAISLNKWSISHENKQWIYVIASANEIVSAYQNGQLPDYYIEYNPPHLLNDSMRANHKVDQVHNGIGLSSTYKGSNTIIGVIDTGIDVGHPDFQDENGKTRILRYWDQTLNIGTPPMPFNFGHIWDSTAINAGLCTSMDNNAHGTTVAGAAAGNGRSTGYNQGVAPESDLIIVKTNLSSPNWATNVAQSCDYIFSVADSLGMNAVINISLGTYLGSHDGTDAASLYINDLLDEKEGRIVVSACGNSGNFGKFHCQGTATIDTTFTWFANNTNGNFGPNKIFFDLYSDLDQAGFHYGFKAVNPANNYETRGSTQFHLATSGTSPSSIINDTIWSSNGDRIATIEVYPSIDGDNLHLQVLFRNVDSTNYHFGFYTSGEGTYDLWSGTALGYNTIIESIPTAAVLPSIVNYNLPDANQTIVSSWNCSPKVVSVGNTRNRQRFPNLAGGEYVPSDFTPNGHLSPNSSKGPTRDLRIKPDVAASGDVTLAPGPLWFLEHPSNVTKIDTGGMHMGNGGTSMASPVVAGVAALFLERCSKANYQDFLVAIQNSSMSNSFTGTLPNNAYGYGLISAHDLLLAQEYEANIIGDTLICQDPLVISIENESDYSSVLWSTSENTFTIHIDETDTLSALLYNQFGCTIKSDTLIVRLGEIATIDVIEVSEDFTTLTTNSSNGIYQWTLNGTPISGATSNSYSPTEELDGVYDCFTITDDGCITYAGEVGVHLSVIALQQSNLKVFPNPGTNFIQIQIEDPIQSVQLFDVSGKEIPIKWQGTSIDVSNCSVGLYQLKVTTDKGVYQTKWLKK